MKSYFITSSGTDIGKTYLTCGLIKALQAAGENVQALKPIISGWNTDNTYNDVMRILYALDKTPTKQTIEAVNKYRFKAAFSPDMAGREEGKNINFQELIDYCKQQCDGEYNLIEGVGGVMVPLNKAYTVLDWIEALDMAVILVVGSYLGSISHTLSAIEALKSRNIRIAAIVISQSEQGIDGDELQTTLRQFVKQPIIYLARDGGKISPSQLKIILGE